MNTKDELSLKVKKVLWILVTFVLLLATLVCIICMVACAINSWQMQSVNATQMGMQFWFLIAVFSLLTAVSAMKVEKISAKIIRLECQ